MVFSSGGMRCPVEVQRRRYWSSGVKPFSRRADLWGTSFRLKFYRKKKWFFLKIYKNLVSFEALICFSLSLLKNRHSPTSSLNILHSLFPEIFQIFQSIVHSLKTVVLKLVETKLNRNTGIDLI